MGLLPSLVVHYSKLQSFGLLLLLFSTTNLSSDSLGRGDIEIKRGVGPVISVPATIPLIANSTGLDFLGDW
jgi:hypothetical protein